MNFRNEPYPTSIAELINRCENAQRIISNLLNDKNCKTLAELYLAGKNGKVIRLNKEFENLGYIPNCKLSQKAKACNEIKGLYVFGELENDIVVPKYVGISGSIFRRLKQHGWGKFHNEATLAYLKAASKSDYIGERKNLLYSDLEKQQQIIRQYKVAILPEMLDFDLYFMEVYISGYFKTYWNSFKTH